MLVYLCDRFELTIEQRYWMAFLYSTCYCGPTTFYFYNEFPDYENVNVGRLHRWWFDRGRAEIICQTDRRWVRSSSMFVPAFDSYRKWLNGRTQHEHFAAVATGDTPEERYRRLYKSATQLHSFGQFALFLYLEALHTITPLDLAPTDLDLNIAWSCRNGLYYAYGMDEFIEDTESRTPPAAVQQTHEKWASLRATLAGLEEPPTVWQTETMLCAYRKFHRRKRYVGYYLDRQALETAKMTAHVRNGVSWDVLWQYRAETYQPSQLVENVSPWEKLAVKGLPESWKSLREDATLVLLADAPKSFLDDINVKSGCILECHDVNHNGDFSPDGCGNPECWKHTPSSPPPRPYRPPMCRCPHGTFEGEK